MWRTTTKRKCTALHLKISIHVPRVEDDNQSWISSKAILYFNPRPPCGGRRRGRLISQQVCIFQSTSPVWRTTPDPPNIPVDLDEFQSTSPVWRTTKIKKPKGTIKYISIHVPRVEDDETRSAKENAYRISIHVPRVEDDGLTK